MQLRTLVISTLAALPLLALAESDSPWLPIPGQFSLGVNHTEQSGVDAYIGATQLPLSAITGGGASNYKRATTSLRVDYGLSDSLAFDAAIGYAKVKVGAADSDSSMTDSTLGMRWRVLDEYENPALPTLTLRGAAILKGNYDGARLASVGKDSNGFEAAVVLGKQILPALALWAEVGAQKRDNNVPGAIFYELGARFRFAPMWSASLGYIDKKFRGDLDIGGTGFSPARFQGVREERGVVKLSFGYAFARNQGLALNLAKTTSGRNTVKDDQVIGLSYASPSKLHAVGWRAWAVGALGGLQSAVLVWGSGAPAAAQLFAVLAAATLGGLAMLWIAFDSRFAQTPLAWVIGLALLLRLIAVQAEPLLEDDHYRYLWDGMRTAQHFDPYRLAPSAFFGSNELAPQWQDVLSGINNPSIPTLYGPVLQALFALAHWLAPGRIGAVQGLVLLVDLGCIGLLARQGVGARWLLVYALHPMILKEAMASAHPDGLVALWLLLALLAWRNERRVFTGALLGLAVATKVAALLVVPLFLFGPQRTVTFWRTSSAMALGFVVALGAAYLPFLAAGGSDVLGLKTFATEWRFNPLLFRVIEAGVPNGMARPVAALMIVAGMLALLWRWRRSPSCADSAGRNAALPPVDTALLLLLLLAPVVNPWYLLWALGPAIAAHGVLVPVMGCVSVLAYLNGSVLGEAGWQAARELIVPYGVPWPVALIQVAAVALVAAWIRRSRAA